MVFDACHRQCLTNASNATLVPRALYAGVGLFMTNSVFQALSKQKVETFRSAFSALANEVFYDEVAGRLRHSAEFGAYRERICADFLRLYLPSYLRVGSGFLINGYNDVSTQCDLLIYDPEHTPLVEDASSHRFFPVETVAAIGEVKSTLSKQGLRDALIKLSASKAMRKIEQRTPVRRAIGISQKEIGHHWDNVVSFLVCQKFDFNTQDITSEISKFYDEASTPLRDRHNLVLSIEDGVLCYRNHLLARNVAWMYPYNNEQRMKNRFISPGENGRNHFGIFTSYMFMLCVNATIYLPELRVYDEEPVTGVYQDET